MPGQLDRLSASLPYYGRVDLAYLATQTVFNAISASGKRYVVPGDRAIVPLSALCVLDTDAQVDNREVQLRVEDAGGNVIYAVPISATIPASTHAVITFSADSAFAYGSGDNFVANIPGIPLQPGWQLEIIASHIGAGDVLTFGSLTNVVIPTGPAVDRSLALVAPPIIL